MVRKIDKSEWVYILIVMNQYNRAEGFVNDVGGKLKFFDSNACIGDCYSLYVTKRDVEGYINNYND